MHDSEGLAAALQAIRQHEDHILSQTTATLPPRPDISAARTSLVRSIPTDGLGVREITRHLVEEVAPGLNGNSLASRYYGFITGGVTPAARVAEHLSTTFDQNVQVHLPEQTVATNVEDASLRMLLELLGLDTTEWCIRILTTGATAGNITGLAAGRDAVLQKAAGAAAAVSGMGVLEACNVAGIRSWQVLTSKGHSSLSKAANIVGIGRASVVDVGRQDRPVVLDLEKLEKMLSQPNTGSIVAVSCGEVNTGDFATQAEDMRRIRALCDKHGAWLHVDGAFGIFARCLAGSGPQYAKLVKGAAGIELADSIAGDCHKMLNVPYDSGFYFSRHKDLQLDVFQNPNAAYLSGGAVDIPSPLNIGIENSRRFRALPLYGTLLAYGRAGYTDMLERQVNLSRRVAKWILASPGFELIQGKDNLEDVFMVVLFRSADRELSKVLVERINESRRLYVSGTAWDGQPAVRMAIANWQVGDADYDVVVQVLQEVWSRWEASVKQ